MRQVKAISFPGQNPCAYLLNLLELIPVQIICYRIEFEVLSVWVVRIDGVIQGTDEQDFEGFIYLL